MTLLNQQPDDQQQKESKRSQNSKKKTQNLYETKTGSKLAQI
jgi:hypothetical protein